MTTARLVTEPREPLRPVVTTPRQLTACIASLKDGRGPVAFDAERAHGYRYWPKAYLFQIRRETSGTWLIDPIAFEHEGVTDLSDLVTACGEAVWLIHAASQDLDCMRSAGIVPPAIFDTELAARLLGMPGTALGYLLAELLGIRLKKAHSAANWAKRPLPTTWLNYAALDVDYLIELYEVLAQRLAAAQRSDWAEQESAAALAQASNPPSPKAEPWRKLKGLRDVKQPRQLAIARALWQEREAIAQQRDRPPSHILADDTIVALALRVDENWSVQNQATLAQLPGFGHRYAKRYLTNWHRALTKAASLTKADWPRKRPPITGVGHPRTWPRHHPQAAARWDRVSPLLAELTCEIGIQQSLIAPTQPLRQVIFDYQGDPEAELSRAGLRPWQLEFLVPLLHEALDA